MTLASPVAPQQIYGAPLPHDADVLAGTPLPFFTSARHLRVDALRGVLYWATERTVDASYLNGEESRHLFETRIFSGKQARERGMKSRQSEGKG